VRLGRVLALQSKPDAALAVFRDVRNRLDGGFAYLVRLFEGEAFEQRGDVARAEESYAAAHAMMPRAQSAIVALANLAFAAGRRAEALEYTRALKDSAAAGRSVDPWVWHAQGADPWSWYCRGTNLRFPIYLAKLRALVRQEP
jgi:tetratricopeptide (TPR) repeat protein